MEKIEKKCIDCNARFKTLSETVDKCNSCRRIAVIKKGVVGKEYECPKCLSSFTPSTQTQVFCSVVCRRRSRTDVNKTGLSATNCPCCNTLYTPKSSKQMFCGSKKCNSKVLKALLEKKSKAKKCGVCEREFTPTTEGQEVCGSTRYCTADNLIQLNKERDRWEAMK
jgi:hypothetical protein